ncbi:hypothetical protein [Chlorobium ferrooxidans]|nr:hypothetical protein [Chlorobium ferrooxidans]
MNLEDKFDDNNSLFGKDYFIDLSQVRFAELNAIVELILIVEKLIQKSNIYIALPTIMLTEKEEKKHEEKYSEENKIKYLNQRKRVNNFIKTVGFVNALKQLSERSINQVYLTEEYQFEAKFNVESFINAFSTIFETKNIEFNNYRFIFPLEWIDCKKGVEGFSGIENKIDKVLGNSERGLESIDVQGIKNVIISELIKNVNEHSQVHFALLAIGLIESKILFSEYRYKKINPIENEYINWIRNDGVKTQVEIYFGDSGNGILTNDYEFEYFKENIKTEKESQLEWAFQKWSTTKNKELRRGTKGLYRIQRIVNKYNGIFHIRTGVVNGGFRKGGLIEEEWISRKCKYNYEGTFIQIKMCPFSEAKEFRFTLTDNTENKQWKTVQYNPGINRDFIELFEKEVKKNKDLLVILNLTDLDESTSQTLLEETLPGFSFNAHPRAVVIYLLSPLSNDTIQIIVDSSNEYIKRKTDDNIFQEIVHRDTEEVYDPVLIIGNDNKAFWYGGNQNLINLLNESYQIYDDEIKISELKSYKTLNDESKNRIRLHLENDNKLVNVDRLERLTFNFTNIDSFFENEIIKMIDKTEKNKKKYCSPKLETVEKWLDVKKLLEYNEYGYALTLYLKYKNNIEKEIINQSDYLTSSGISRKLNKESKSNYFILIDHNLQKGLAKAFAVLCGVAYKNIICLSEDINQNIPRRTKLFKHNAKVIVLTTVISSSETVRRSVKYIKRDSAIPLCVLCLCNNRKYNISELKTWGDNTEIISVYRKNKVELDKNETDAEYFKNKYNSFNEDLEFKGPNYETEEKIRLESKKYEVELNLRKHIILKKAFHYNHIGKYSDRHFTFYINKQKLLNTVSVIWKKISESIAKWQNGNVVDYVIYIPKNLIDGVKENDRFYKYLKELSGNVVVFDEIPKLINHSNVVYFDFGVISFKTINTLITKCQQVSNLLICVLFDQTKDGELELYKRIETLSNEEITAYSQPTKFTIDCLYKLHLGYFNSESCPVCEHCNSLEKYKLAQQYMNKFSDDRQARLKIIDPDEINKTEYPYDYYYTAEKPDHELSSELIMRMFEFKTLLEKAEKNTQFRIEVYKYVYSIYSNIDGYISICYSNLYAMIYYLSYEVNWLQKEPLVFRDFRVMISKIALKIATIKLGDLSEKLIKTNNSITTPEKISVRYKYSAISLLRSSNKLLFCESISDILMASYNGQVLSDNLMQNTIYHMTSLFQNKYNQSIKYFSSISDQLKYFVEKSENISIEQKVTLGKINNLNDQTIKNIEIKSIKTDIELIKSLKNEKNKYYEGTRHPFPDNCLSNMNLSEFTQDCLYDLELYKENSEYYPLFLIVTNKLLDYWRQVSYFIEATIQSYTIKLSEKIKKSSSYQHMFFHDLAARIFDGDNQLGVTDEFSVLVHQIHENPLYYLRVKKKYDYYHNVLTKNIISRNSRLFEFIDQFPVNLKEVIEEKFKSVFPLTKINNTGERELRVFYPRAKIYEDFDNIIQNIKGRLNDGRSIKEVLINAYIDLIDKNKYVSLLIEYNLTDKNNHNSRTGALTDIKKEIELFGGSLEFEHHTDRNGLFKLQFKFKYYE